MKKIIPLISLLLISLHFFGQRETIRLTFYSIDTITNQSVWIDSLRVMNLTQACDTILYGVDPFITLEHPAGIYDEYYSSNSLSLQQNYPNPFTGVTTFNLRINDNDKEKINIKLLNVYGKIIANNEFYLVKGIHSFRVSTNSKNILLLSVRNETSILTKKLINKGGTNIVTSSISYLGKIDETQTHKHSNLNINGFEYEFGDSFMFKAYAEDYIPEMWVDTPLVSRDYIVDFLPVIGGCPCSDIPTVTYGGQIYNTVKVGEQCWFKENLNIGDGLPFFYDQTDNGVIEKYCYDGNCEKYGGLYYWGEMMNYKSEPYFQGICPEGWHVPTDNDWKVLEGTIDSYYNSGDTIWNSSGWRGFDAGLRMKSNDDWIEDGNGTDNYALSIMPSGYLEGIWDNFYDQNKRAYIWTSTTYVSSYNQRVFRIFSYGQDSICRSSTIDLNQEAFSVRCVKTLGELKLPTVLTDTLVDMYQTNARVNAHVLSDGGEFVTERGICVDTEPTPTINDNVFKSGYGMGPYRSKAKYLLPNTEYYLRAYARNSIGVAYGNEVQFTTLDTIDGIPCPWATTIVDVDSNVYNTVLIGDQCWMKENLKVGRTISNKDMLNNDTIERYCYDNDEANCEIYGGLYQWFEVMNYSEQEGSQGICPDGWHIPTDDEWKELEGKVDSIYGIGDPIWDSSGYRGYDVGKRLKSKDKWIAEGNGIDSHNFSAFPAGRMFPDYSYNAIEIWADFWLSRRGCSVAGFRGLCGQDDRSYYWATIFTNGKSVRCIKD